MSLASNLTNSISYRTPRELSLSLTHEYKFRQVAKLFLVSINWQSTILKLSNLNDRYFIIFVSKFFVFNFREALNIPIDEQRDIINLQAIIFDPSSMMMTGGESERKKKKDFNCCCSFYKRCERLKTNFNRRRKLLVGCRCRQGVSEICRKVEISQSQTFLSNFQFF